MNPDTSKQLAKTMDAFDNLVKAAGDYLEYTGECSDTEPDEIYCESDSCRYCKLARALQEYTQSASGRSDS